MGRKMKDSGVAWIGEIPLCWKVSKIKHFYDCLDGKRVPVDAELRKSGPYPYWGAGSIVDHVNDYIFNEELVLLGEDGAPFFDHTRPVAFLINEPVWVNNHIHVLRPKVDRVNSRFLVHWLNNVDYKSYINGSILNKLTQSNMNTIAFAVPLVDEQIRIANFLDIKCSKIDALLDKIRTSIEEYKKLKQAIITQAVTKGVRGDRPMKESGIKWIGEIPADWETIALKKCVDILPGYAFSSGDFDTENGIPLLRGINVGLNEIRWEDVVYWNKPLNESLEAFRLEENDIVVGLDRPWISGGTRVACIQKCDLPCLLLQRVCRIRPKANIDRRLIYYWISSDMFKEALSNSTTGVSVPHISTKQIEQFIIAAPPNCSDKDICDYLDKQCEEMDVLIQKKECLFSELELYKKSLIFEYVTGKKEV